MEADGVGARMQVAMQCETAGSQPSHYGTAMGCGHLPWNPPIHQGGISPSFNSPLEVNPIHGTFALEQLQVHGSPALAKAADLAVCLQNG